MKLLCDKNIFHTQLYPQIERKAPTLDNEGYTKVGDFTIRKNIDFIPQHGLQEFFCTIGADVLFAGGEPGGGKSFGEMIAAMAGIDKYGYNALIIKKELVSAKQGGGSIVDYAKEIYIPFSECEFSSSDNPTFSWRKWNSSIQFTHANFEGETDKSIRDQQEKAKNKQASFIAFDELTDFPYSTWSYYFSRNRDNSGMKPRMICTFNCNGWHFTRRMIDWYIDDEGLIIPERCGILRYFILNGETENDIIWGDTKQEVIDRAEIKLTKAMRDFGLTEADMVKSFTFIPCNMMDNKILIHNTKGGHVSNVFNTGSSEQKKLFYGYWNETQKGDSMLTNTDIKSQFTNAFDEDKTMYMTADIGDGGDPSIAIIWRGLTKIAREINYTDDAPTKVQWLEDLMRQYNINPQNMAYDGSTIGNYIKGYILNCIPIISRNRPLPSYDENAKKTIVAPYESIIDQLMDKLVAYHKSRLISCTIEQNTLVEFGRNRTLKPYNEILCTEKELYVRFKNPNGKWKYESKNVFKRKYHYSPDDADCEKYRMIWEIDTKLKEVEPEITYDDYMSAYSSITEDNFSEFYN
ncbi:MAG: terminase family protein [Muribaculaceae bacterium]